MSKNKIELKPCPHCGGEAEIISVNALTHFVHCKECNLLRAFISQKDAAAAWNSRDNSKVAAGLADLKKILTVAMPSPLESAALRGDITPLLRKGLDVIDKLQEVIA
ncbi:MAG: Lar family restriction alleviation protein [Synergistaceae bacterium]|nr:Lar family restriction alleviation protein [Synergistaceae bacterium]